MSAPIAGPSGTPLLGNTLALRKNPTAYLLQLQKEYGDLVQIHLGWIPIILVFHPDQVRQILVENHKSFIKSRGTRLTELVLGKGLLTIEGKDHRRQRKLIQPAFQKRRIEGYAPFIQDACSNLLAGWKDGDIIDLHRNMMRLALVIASRSLFDADVESDAPHIGRALDRSMQDFNRVVSHPLGRYLVKLPTPAGLRFRAARKDLDRIIYRIIKERKANPEDRGDFLSILFSAADEEGGMTEKQIRDEAMTIFLAGHETTANALSWSLYLVSKHPQFEARLQEELQGLSVIKPDSTLPLTEALFAESMRMYPPVWALGREAIEPVEIGGHTFKTGTTFLLSPYVTHRDSRFWDAPNDFRPGRWLEPDLLQHPRFRYFPFGGGPRICIGEPFAWMEGKMALAAILRDWSFEIQEEPPVREKPLVTLRPEFGIHARLKRR
ncbi:MAG: cytochrome P450 [Leptospiraceae bacterium]|nr:cytochrome P450 [Leptospiraceae bacterium]